MNNIEKLRIGHIVKIKKAKTYDKPDNVSVRKSYLVENDILKEYKYLQLVLFKLSIVTLQRLTETLVTG